MPIPTAASTLTRGPGRKAELFSGPTRLLPARELTSGQRVVYRLNGNLLAETVTDAWELTVPAGYMAVRFTGRQHDVHYPITTCVRVAR